MVYKNALLDNHSLEHLNDFFLAIRNDKNELLSNEIALEGFLDVLRKIIPTSIAKFVGLSNNLNKGDIEDVKLLKSDKKVIDLVSKIDYIDLQKIPLTFTDGLIKDFLEYSGYIRDSAVFVSNIEKKLKEFDTYITKIMNDEEYRKTTNGLFKDYENLLKTKESIRDNLSTCFDSKKISQNYTYGDVIKRNSDWPLIFKNVRYSGELLLKIKPRNVEKNVKEISTHLTYLKELIENGNLDNCNSTTVKNIQKGIEVVAEYVEFFSITVYSFNVLVTSIDKLSSTITNMKIK